MPKLIAGTRLTIIPLIIISLLSCGNDYGLNGENTSQSDDFFAAHVRKLSGDDAPKFGIHRVIDGDTFTIDWYENSPYEGKDISIRVRGVDTPEMKGKCPSEKVMANTARTALISKLKGVNGLAKIHLSDLGRDKFGRILAKVYVQDSYLSEYEDLAEYLINNGYGRAYNGSKRDGWCS